MRHAAYKTTNLLTGRFYIGIHSTSNPADGYKGSGRELRADIARHGKHNFETRELRTFATYADMVQWEREHVTPAFTARADTYNTHAGGAGRRPCITVSEPWIKAPVIPPLPSSWVPEWIKAPVIPPLPQPNFN